VSRFLARYKMEVELARNAGVTEALLRRIKKADPKISAERLREIGQAFFSALTIRRKDTRGWYMTQSIELKKGKLDLEREKFRDQSSDRKARLKALLKPPSKKRPPTGKRLQEISQKLNLL